MSATDEIWSTRLHAAVDDHPGALAFDVASHVAAGRRRTRRNRAATVLGSAALVAAVVVGVTAVGTRDEATQPAPPVAPDIPSLGPATNGWIAVDSSADGGSVFLLRNGQEPVRMDAEGPDDATEACPVWSPDGSRLMFGRVSPGVGAELVVVRIEPDGTVGHPITLTLEGFTSIAGFDTHPCGVWAPDGRWAALASAGEVWVADYLSNEIRRLPDLRPSDLAWRPGTDELYIAGDLGDSRADPVEATTVSTYTVSTGELRQLEDVSAAHLTWSPDGSTLAFTGGESDVKELWLTDPDGEDTRLLAPLGEANHGIGPEWSPTGDLIAYQRVAPGSREGHEVVLLDARDGSETLLVEPPTRDPDEGKWFPFAVSWSPDGGSLLYTGWRFNEENTPDGVITVPVPNVDDFVELAVPFDAVGDTYGRGWSVTQRWGRLAP
jgi:WD40-like Beta Propeller Repeat